VIYVVVGIWSGVVEEIRAFRDEKRAEKVAEELKEEFGVDEAQEPSLRERDVYIFAVDIEG